MVFTDTRLELIPVHFFPDLLNQARQYDLLLKTFEGPAVAPTAFVRLMRVVALLMVVLRETTVDMPKIMVVVGTIVVAEIILVADKIMVVVVGGIVHMSPIIKSVGASTTPTNAPSFFKPLPLLRILLQLTLHDLLKTSIVLAMFRRPTRIGMLTLAPRLT